jgi:hypothetical protein
VKVPFSVFRINGDVSASLVVITYPNAVEDVVLVVFSSSRLIFSVDFAGVANPKQLFLLICSLSRASMSFGTTFPPFRSMTAMSVLV